MKFASLTNVGERTVNEDSCGISSYEDTHCFVVADGLGGHGGGDIASQTAVYIISSMFMEKGFSKDFFQNAFDQVQKEILKLQDEKGNKASMRTTIVCLVIENGKAHFAHVGDSRGYYFNNGSYKQRTRDHSVPQMLLEIKAIKEEDIRHHSDRNKLMQVMGDRAYPPELEVDKPIKLSGKQAFLLCTDGLWELIEEKDMEKLLKENGEPQEWINQIAEIVNVNGKKEYNGKRSEMDNFTGIAVMCETKKKFWGLL